MARSGCGCQLFRRDRSRESRRLTSWSTLPLYVGTKVDVKVREAPESDVDGRRIRIFQYSGSTEDEPCLTRTVRDYGLFSFHKDYASCSLRRGLDR